MLLFEEVWSGQVNQSFSWHLDRNHNVLTVVMLLDVLLEVGLSLENSAAVRTLVLGAIVLDTVSSKVSIELLELSEDSSTALVLTLVDPLQSVCVIVLVLED